VGGGGLITTAPIPLIHLTNLNRVPLERHLRVEFSLDMVFFADFWFVSKQRQLTKYIIINKAKLFMNFGN